MILTVVGFILLALGVFGLFRKTEGETEISALGIKLKSTNSAILLICLGGLFILFGQTSPISLLDPAVTQLPGKGGKESATSPSTLPGSPPEASNSPAITPDQQMPAGKENQQVNREDFARQKPVFSEGYDEPGGSAYFAGYVGRFPEASAKLLTYSDIAGKTPFELKIMRNEIFARHGYIFKTPQMKSYFNNQAWYRPLYKDVTDRLTPVEKRNVEYIKEFEQ